jgi:hypothetical protein
MRSSHRTAPYFDPSGTASRYPGQRLNGRFRNAVYGSRNRLADFFQSDVRIGG